LAVVAATVPASAQQLWFDTNGATTGSGNANGTWDAGTTAAWTTNSAGTAATGFFGTGNTTTAVFAAGTDFTGTRTVTIAGTVAPAGILLESEVVNLTLTGGTIDFGTVRGVIDSSAMGAATGRIAVISTPLVGSNGVTINANGNLTATGGGSSALFRLNADNSGLTGGIFITGGLVALPNAAAAGGNKITLSNFGGVLDTNINLQLPNDIEVLSSGGTFRTYGSVTTTNFSGTLTGSGNINRTDGGVLTLSGDASGYTGTYNNQAGTTVFTNTTWADRRFDVQIGAITFNFSTPGETITPASLTVAGTVNLNNDASLNVPVLPMRVASASAISRPAGTSGNLTSSTGTLTINGIDATGAIATGLLSANNHTIGVDIVDAAGGTTPVTLVKNGTSAVVLNNTNTYTGGTTINGGRIQASNAAAFGTGTVTVNNGGQAFLAVAGPFANNFILNGLGQAETAGTLGALRLTGSTINGQITLAGNARINAHGSNGTLAGGIVETGGSRSLEFGGSGSASTVTLTSTAAYTGLTTISNATVNVGTAAAPATSNLLASSSGFVLGSVGGTGNGALNLNVNASYTFNKPITIGSAGSSLTFLSTDASSIVTVATPIGTDPTFGFLGVSGAQLRLPSGSIVNMSTVSLTSNPSNSATGAVATLNIEPGATLTSRYFNIGNGSNTAGVVNQTGGTVTLLAGDNGIRLGHWANGLTPQNQYNLTGGTLDASALETNTGAARFVNVGWDGQAAMNVGGGAGTATLRAFGIQVDANGDTAAANSTFTLANNGVVELGGGGIAGASATDRVVFTGSNTLRAMSSSTVSAVIDATAGGTTAIDVTGASTLTLTSTLTGSPTFNKQGSGVLQVNTALPAGLTLNATAGRVVFGTAANATANVNIGAATELAGAVNVGNLTTAAGALVFPGTSTADNAIGTLAASAASLVGTTMRFNLNGASTTAGGTTNDLIAVTGNATIDGGVIQPVFTGTVTVGNVYSLVTAANLTVSNAPTVDASAVNNTRLTFALGSTATALTLTVGGANKALVWTGVGGATWNLNSTSNWQDSAPIAEKYFDYDDVTFNDTGATASTVNIADTLRPGSVTVTGSANYTLSGTGNIASGSLAKSGTGTLTLATNNTYPGTTSITGGRLSVGGGGTSGSLGLGTVTITTPGRLEINRSDTHTVSPVIAGNGGIDYVGSGTTIITGTNTYTGGTLVTRGTLALRANAALGSTGTVTVGNATTGAETIQIGIDNSIDTPTTLAFTVPAGPTGLVIFSANAPGVASNASTFGGVFTLNRPVTFRGAASDRLAIDGRITGNVGTLTIDGGSRTTFLSTANDFVGNVLIRGTNTILQASVGSAGETVPNNSNVDIGPGALFQLASSANGTETISALLGSGTVTRNVASLQTLAVGFSGSPGAFSGIIQNGSGTVALSKVGGGIQSLSGANTYTGGTTVTAGILLADTPGPTNSATGTGTVTVNGGWLGGSGRIAGAVTVNPNGTIAPGPIPVVGGTVGTLSVASPVTLASGAGVAPTLAIKVRNAANSSDVLALSGTAAAGVLTLSNVDVLNILPVENITTARTYTIATFASVVGEFDSVLIAGQPSQNTNPAQPNYALVTYNATNIQLTVNNVVAVPEPAAIGLASTGLGLLAMRRRRRR
jgi:autotransporter-associated beta strand protein